MCFFLSIVFSDVGSWATNAVPVTRPIDSRLVQMSNFEDYDPEAANQNPIKCANCGKTYTWLYSLKRHLLSCGNNEAKYVCQFCTDKFFNSDRLRYHMRTVHNFNKSQKKWN